MDAKLCDRITCGIITVMAIIYLIQARDVLFLITAGLLCGIMWWKVGYVGYKGDSSTIDGFSMAVSNMNMYIIVLVGLYAIAASGLNWESREVLENLAKGRIAAYIVMIVLTLIFHSVFSGKTSKKGIAAVLCSILYVTSGLRLFGEEYEYMLPFCISVIMLLAILSFYWILRSSGNISVPDATWIYLGIFPFILINGIVGNGTLYQWFVKGQITTMPAWWVWIGLIAIGIVNLSVGHLEWKRASFGLAVLLFLAMLAGNFIWKTGFQLHAVLAGLLLLDMIFDYVIKKGLIKNNPFGLAVVGMMYLPILLLISILAAWHRDQALLIGTVLVMAVMLFVHWGKEPRNVLSLFGIGFGITLLFLAVRYTNGGEHTALLVVTSAIFWALFALNAGETKQNMEFPFIVRCSLIVSIFVMILSVLHEAIPSGAIFYLEKETSIFSKENPNLVFGVLTGNTDELKNVLIEWNDEDIITLTPEEANEYHGSIHSLHAKVTLVMEDGTERINQQYFLKVKEDE